MRAEELDREGMSSDVAGEPAAASVQEGAELATDSLGARLRRAREARGLGRADAAARLKLPLRLIARLEEDDYEGIDQGLYLRGYLKSYAALVGVSLEDAELTAAAHTRAVPLVATGTVSRSRYLFDRYSVSATYLILTGLIVVPAVWLATHGGLEQNLARTTPLDSPTTTIAVPAPGEPRPGADRSAADGVDVDEVQASSGAVAPPNEQMPVVASMTPFAASSAPAQVTPPETEPEPASVAADKAAAHTLVLALHSDSWVEITADDGSKLEYSLLRAGSIHTYTSNGPLSVRLGNAEGAEVKTDGKAVDLAPFRRANVASLRVFGADGAASHAEF